MDVSVQYGSHGWSRTLIVTGENYRGAAVDADLAILFLERVEETLARSIAGRRG
jgi:hypothetical protein